MGSSGVCSMLENSVIDIRPYLEPDREGVIALWGECGLIVPWNDPEKDIDRKMQVNPELFLVAVIGNRVVGTVMGGYEGHRGWINYLAVSTEQRRVGIGARLVDNLESLLLERGCPKLNLQIRATNTDVIAFYRDIGFTEDAAVSMGKRLIPDL